MLFISALSGSRTRATAALIREELSARSCPPGRGAENLPAAAAAARKHRKRAEKKRQSTRFKFGDVISADYDIKRCFRAAAM